VETPVELPDDAVVVRGGVMALEDLRRAAIIHFRERGEYALSGCP
jgi:hypothetical protein